MLDKEIVLVGYSGHGYVVAEAAILCDLNLKYYSEVNKLNKNPYRLEYLGFEKDLSFIGWNDKYSFVLGLGNNNLRLEIFNLIKSKGLEILNVVHKSASVSNDLNIGEGNFIARNASINPLVIIGDCCIINTGSVLEHECIIKTGAHIAPGVVLAGNVTIGENSFVGANSVIKEGVTIGNNVIIGAGSVILKDIEDNKKVVGNPTREI
ncbi:MULTISPECIES: acetyltransferase [Flavobacteriaceae]|uniref:acetyltransferase n=1 Tax=Flavobacteriaceae TaxID=49546 RepID=UPI003AA83815